MIVKILGVLDIFVAICFWIFGVFHLGILSGFILVLGLFLLVKGIAFGATSLNIVSIIDIICAIIIIAATAVAMPVVIVVIVSLFILQKGIFSVIS